MEVELNSIHIHTPIHTNTSLTSTQTLQKFKLRRYVCFMNLNKPAAYVDLSDVLMSLCESQLEVSAVNTFPSSPSIKENAKQTENAAVSGQILTHGSCCDTVTVVNYIFTL